MLHFHFIYITKKSTYEQKKISYCIKIINTSLLRLLKSLLAKERCWEVGLILHLINY